MAIAPQQRTAENDEPARRNCNRLVQACQTDRATAELLAIQTETEQSASIMSASQGPVLNAGVKQGAGTVPYDMSACGSSRRWTDFVGGASLEVILTARQHHV